MRHTSYNCDFCKAEVDGKNVTQLQVTQFPSGLVILVQGQGTDPPDVCDGCLKKVATALNCHLSIEANGRRTFVPLVTPPTPDAG